MEFAATVWVYDCEKAVIVMERISNAPKFDASWTTSNDNLGSPSIPSMRS
jgi:isopentenyldiphosphate isomerase